LLASAFINLLSGSPIYLEIKYFSTFLYFPKHKYFIYSFVWSVVEARRFLNTKTLFALADENDQEAPECTTEIHYN